MVSLGLNTRILFTAVCRQPILGSGVQRLFSGAQTAARAELDPGDGVRDAALQRPNLQRVRCERALAML